MATPVYSTRFITTPGVTSVSPTFTVPDDVVLVLKQLTAYCNAGIDVVRVFLEDGPSSAALWSAQFDAEASGWAGFYGAIVFEPGGSFAFTVTSELGTGVDVGAFGYLLSLP